MRPRCSRGCHTSLAPTKPALQPDVSVGILCKKFFCHLLHVPECDSAVAAVGEGAEPDGEALVGEARAQHARVVVAGHDVVSGDARKECDNRL